ncbi:MAG: cation-transporting P-type ATPase, partial [candidate division Zixibacteria bacterium]|nr:cation-transporting P-type ATPase [candidate division Zixibacteria bacterium]NIS46525.1 cation-transporting P-type ATPase [candidate division Zixibacteria bacterium]NIV06638.1 cation-transporting P-type ATPase [candidate division Zixibacteria bacterium]NIW45474.1 cation-transporting P-type ATPase [Gammaproteobacteria bacterium]
MAGSSNHNQFIPWGEEYEYILEVLDVDPDEGLTEEEVKRRRKEEGYNRLRTKGKKSAWSILIEQFKNIIIWILIISAGVSVIFGEYIDAIAVLVVIILNT